jgi:hypothetical protein
MSNLPPGVTDSMCEPSDDPCERCGHRWSEHLLEDDYIYNAYGEVTIACNMKSCMGCEGYIEGEYEPWQPDTLEEYYA